MQEDLKVFINGKLWTIFYNNMNKVKCSKNSSHLLKEASADIVVEAEGEVVAERGESIS